MEAPWSSGSPAATLRRNWGLTGKGAAVWVQMDHAVGVGHLPANASSKVDITGLQALSEVEAPLVDPVITVGDQTALAKATLSMCDQFTLDPDGTFTIYGSGLAFRVQLLGLRLSPHKPHELQDGRCCRCRWRCEHACNLAGVA